MRMDVGDCELAYEVSGNGPWLVLSHSLASARGLWEEQAALLEKTFTVLRYDIRGHGESSAPAGSYTMHGLSEDANTLLVQLGIERATWVGLSLGGMIGQSLALAYPARIERLVLADATAGYGAEGKAAWNDRIAAVEQSGMEAVAEGSLGRYFTPAFRERAPQTVAWVRQLLLATPPDGFIGCGRAIQAMDFWDDIPAIACPTLVLVGEEDAATPPAMAARMAQAIPGAELEVIRAAAHLSCVEQPAAFNDALMQFLAR